jgi:hypothetical protein
MILVQHQKLLGQAVGLAARLALKLSQPFTALKMISCHSLTYSLTYSVGHRLFKWQHFAITQQFLTKPVVACDMGSLNSKEAVKGKIAKP